MQAEQRRPEVTLTASSLPRAAEPTPTGPPRRGPTALLLLSLLAGGLALTSGRPPPPAPPATPVPDAELRLLDERLSTSHTGILVLPVELRNGGGALQVQRIQPYAFPLRVDPSVQAPVDVAAGQRRAVVLILVPDCGLLDRGSSGLFQASLLVRVASGTVSRDLVLDLADSAPVHERVDGLCA